MKLLVSSSFTYSVLGTGTRQVIANIQRQVFYRIYSNERNDFSDEKMTVINTQLFFLITSKMFFLLSWFLFPESAFQACLIYSWLIHPDVIHVFSFNSPARVEVCYTWTFFFFKNPPYPSPHRPTLASSEKVYM